MMINLKMMEKANFKNRLKKDNNNKTMMTKTRINLEAIKI